MTVVRVGATTLIATYVISLFWGIAMCFKALWLIMKGPCSYFHTKDRSERPQILDNPDFGTGTTFVKLVFSGRYYHPGRLCFQSVQVIQGGTPARSGWVGRLPQPRDRVSPSQGWGAPRIGQQMEYLMRRGRYASCVHAGGLSCFIQFLTFCVF